MKLKTNIRIIIIGLMLFLPSFLPDLYPSLFGDWLCEGSGNKIIRYIDNIPIETNYYQRCNYGANYYHTPEWHYGYRHWLGILFGLILAIYNFIEIFSENSKK